MPKLSAAVIVATAIAAFSLLETANSKLSFGFCPKPALQENFDVNKYTGVWHEYVRDRSLPFEYGDCVQAKYTLRRDGLVTVHNSQYYQGKIDDIKGAAICEGPHCRVGFFLFLNGDYRVLNTDYENYSVVYSCT